MNQNNHFPILIPERVQFLKKSPSKKCIFDSLTMLLEKGQCEISKNEIFDALIAREKLGSTYIGNGIALPRANLEVAHPRASLLALKQGIKLGAADKKPIHIFLAILIPHEDYGKFSLLLPEFNKKILMQEDFIHIINSKNAEKVADYFDHLLT